MKLNAGYSLIELSVTLVILGLLASLAVRYVQQSEQVLQLDTQYNEALVLPVQQAIEGFIYANHRLPCPAQSSSGVEDCGLTSGKVPFATLGLAQNYTNSAGIIFGYEVYANDNLANSTGDASAVNANLTMLVDRNRPFIHPSTEPNLKGTAVHNLNGLDICQAITNARSIYSADPTDSEKVFNPKVVVGEIIDNPDNMIAEYSGQQNGFIYTSVAYVLTDHGYDLLESDDDYKSPTHFDYLWGVLGCVYGESPTGHAHANTVNAAEIMLSSMVDYKVQVNLAADVAGADIAAATATVFMATAEVATAAAALPIGTAQAILTVGTAAPSVALSLAAIAAAAVALVSTAILEAAAIVIKVIADDLVDTAAVLVKDIEDSKDEIRKNMVEADAAGI